MSHDSFLAAPFTVRGARFPDADRERLLRIIGVAKNGDPVTALVRPRTVRSDVAGGWRLDYQLEIEHVYILMPEDEEKIEPIRHYGVTEFTLEVVELDWYQARVAFHLFQEGYVGALESLDEW